MKTRAWIRLPSGKHLDLINPDPQAWLDSDLADRLSRTYRWGGESCWPRPLSVAQHSLNVLALRSTMTEKPMSAGAALRELLHDGEEGLLAFDCISPLKAVLGAPFKEVSDRLTDAIVRRYQLPAWDDMDYRLHKLADELIAASEAVHCAGWPRNEVLDVLEIKLPILEEDPLAEIYDCQPWEPWAPDVACERFLGKLISLSNTALSNTALNT
ncbi:phosphohydrolase [Undibacterium sp. Tian12W]|uniref:phosphohydrolase n=1 Tax=Undibacterium sp. Tian12W TaxID=3413054 RepID=UPI003BF2714C